MGFPGRFVGLVCMLALAACSPYGGGAFHCTDDTQCTGGVGAGQCEDTGYCSFPDGNCASGRSYGGLSGSLAHVCVGAEPVVDGPIDLDGSIDGATTASCVDAWLTDTIRFDPPVELTTVNSAAFDRDPFLSPDELTIYVSSGRPTSMGDDAWQATRPTRSTPFGTPVLSSIFDSVSNETKVSITANGLFAVVGSDRAGGAGGVDVWETSRPTMADTFGPLTRTHVMAVNSSASDHDPMINATGLRLYAAPASGTQHIVAASRATVADNFGAPVTITELDSGTGDADPSVTPDERIIVFSSNRTGSGFTGGNIWYATRASATGTFGTPRPVPDVNSTFSDGDPHLSTDGCRLYFGRDVGATSWDIYTATAR